ncbi:hypothetical protein MB02_12065 [Croceicoccus estronivorus]|nr:hypothetical protein MB02_12065 [Croceicoccus estronivorus]
MTASVRVRFEALANQFRPGLDENAELFTIRTAIAAEYRTGPVRIGGELIDARAYGASTGSSVGTGEVNTFEPVQAYIGADFGPVFGPGSSASLDVGRFVLDLGGRRLVGRNGFRNTTNAFTGLKLAVRGSAREQLTLFYTYPQQRRPSGKADILNNKVQWDREGRDLLFWGGIFSKGQALGPNNLDLYFFALDEDDRAGRNTRDRHLFTPGVRIYRDPAPGVFDYEFEYAYQFGHISENSSPDARKQDVSAHMLHAEVGYSFSGPWQPRLALEYDVATGDGPDGKYGRFDSLYGPRRSDYGPTGIYGPLGRSNINSPGIRLAVKPSKRWDGFVFYRAAWLESGTDSFASTGIRDGSGESGRFAGHQVEARVRYWLLPGTLRLEAGGAALIRGHFLREAPNRNRFGETLYSYVDVTLTI